MKVTILSLFLTVSIFAMGTAVSATGSTDQNVQSNTPNTTSGLAGSQVQGGSTTDSQASGTITGSQAQSGGNVAQQPTSSN